MNKAPHEVYMETVERMESDITMVDRDAALASIAISLKRIADALEFLPQSISQSITEGIFNSTDVARGR